MIQISIIIPAYNAEAFISRTLDSITSNKVNPSDYEIVVVNDGSQDNTLSVVNEYVKNHDSCNINVINQDNGGVSTARNKGIEHAKGDYLWFVDADDYISSISLQYLLSVIQEYHTDLIKMGVYIDEKGEDLSKLVFEPNMGEGRVLNSSEVLHPKTGNFGHTLFLIRRTILMQNNVRYPVGVAFSEDYLFLAKALAYSNTCYLNKSMVFYYYYCNEKSVSKNTRSTERWKKFIEDNRIYALGLLELYNTIQNLSMKEALYERMNTVVFSISQLYRRNKEIWNEIDSCLDNLHKMGIYPIRSSYMSGFKLFIANRQILNKLVARIYKFK